jgi:hypothetical protein
MTCLSTSKVLYVYSKDNRTRLCYGNNAAAAVAKKTYKRVKVMRVGFEPTPPKRSDYGKP